MTKIPDVVLPLPRAKTWSRALPLRTVFSWFAAGWRDTMNNPGTSLIYGVVVCIVSISAVYIFVSFGWDYILFPALAGFMVLGPLFAIGLYEKSRRLKLNGHPTLVNMFVVRPKAGGQLLFASLLLCLLFMLWLRAAVIIYALFFGLTPFPGLDHIAPMLFTTTVGWMMLAVGSLVGALFAAFSYSISVFSVPMLLDRNVDALTATGTSMTLVWNNLPLMLLWGMIVLFLSLLGLATGFLGLIVIFPVLGHATWHAYCAMVPEDDAKK